MRRLRGRAAGTRGVRAARTCTRRRGRRRSTVYECARTPSIVTVRRRARRCRPSAAPAAGHPRRELGLDRGRRARVGRASAAGSVAHLDELGPSWLARDLPSLRCDLSSRRARRSVKPGPATRVGGWPARRPPAACEDEAQRPERSCLGRDGAGYQARGNEAKGFDEHGQDKRQGLRRGGERQTVRRAGDVGREATRRRDERVHRPPRSCTTS